MDTIINLSIFTILLALTGFFVATEFAIVKVRSSRLDQLIAEGNTKAIAAKQVVSHLDEYLSACQLGITVTALGIGMVGEKTFEFMLHPLFEMIGISDKYMTIFTIGTAFAIATFLHVVVGELAPKTAAIQKAETITLLFAKPIMFFYKIMYPFIWFLNGSARVLIGFFGMKPASEHELSHTEEELRLLLSESFKSGEINKTELKYVNNVFEFDERIAREIMVPRTEIVGIERNDSFTTIIHHFAAEKYTRYPIYDGDRDNILGFINAKELFTHGLLEKLTDETLVIEDFINPVIRVIETIPVQELLVRMQKERIHMAILMDEYGGTSGLVTVEDILEEIVGEIRDEFDDDEIADIRKITENHYILNAKMLVEDVENLLNITLEAEEVETLGGWFLSVNNGIKASANIELGSYIFSIYEQQGHQIHYIEVRPLRISAPASLITKVQP
ncbi:hemolysin family protein [Lysinibacillus fusiformis]|uniref:hemolysin family protein n=1 Tax=Lysinibacillus fusiformis TaxID=28031 RepID=UPI000B7E5955|nr:MULTISPECIES: hemolysin family protein [Lysinibacillus]MED4670396.1 hemolysin family protein [Lysinibacillus fusiformis]NOG28776.1 HlyC/CorC family transporter [Lysinibacillus fusiformis]PCD82305.1 HlyC/CorC family transporter [Lysinibacillus fusiformis]QAS56644.1 HlyC/CorC family transporter [Lysinibacillus sphaericus]RDV30309.1 HlyC/CorC family transporter [Lysinibacillus fusiformis]